MRGRVLFFSLEYLGPIFSGNGTYSRSIVRGLQNQGFTTCVVSGRREDVLPDVEATGSNVILDVAIPRDKWNRLDVNSGWQIFADNIVRSDTICEQISSFDPQVILTVDWHGMAALQALRDAATAHGTASDDVARDINTHPTSNWRFVTSIPVFYMNFRVYSMSPGLVEDEAAAAFYRAAERSALLSSDHTICLCRQDAISLLLLANAFDPVSKRFFDSAGRLTDDPALQDAAAIQRNIHILLPALRADIAELALKSTTHSDGWCSGDDVRRLITCLVRQSPEKNAHLFAEICCSETFATFAKATRLTPYICGAAGDVEYAGSVRSRIRAAGSIGYEPVIETNFLNPEGFQAVLSNAVLNVHPAFADAYGMTIVEAAAFGVPTAVHFPLSTRSAIASATPPARFVHDLIHADHGYLRMQVNDHLADATRRGLCDALSSVSFPTVGACDLLGDPAIIDTMRASGTDNSSIIAVDWSLRPEHLVARIQDCLEHRSILHRVGQRARAIALSWQEEQASAALARVIDRAVQ